MSSWQIEPFVGVGPLTFGMARDSVRQQLNEEPRVIVRKVGHPPLEQYPRSGLQAYYDSLGRLELVAFYPHGLVEIGGIELLGRELDAVLRDLARVGLSARDDGVGDIMYDSQGFGLYIEGGEIASVSAFSREYANRKLAGGGTKPGSVG